MAGLTFKWEPANAPTKLAESMTAVSNALEARIVPLTAASEVMQADIRERFTSETDPEGNAWARLSESYTIGGWPENQDGRPINKRWGTNVILKDTRELMNVASSSQAQVVTNDTVFYKTGVLPQYGLAHEQGLPDRVGIYGPNPLPKRSFLGLSAQSEDVIFGFFDEWFDGCISLYPTATGKLGRRHAKHIVGPTGMHVFVPAG